jgi:uncharacterized protein YlzI (FlbEa/FlbD family)
MIKLSNTGKFTGFSIYINVDHITAVFEVPSEQGGSLETHIYGGNSGNGVEWIVEESLNEVIKKINETN